MTAQPVDADGVAAVALGTAAWAVAGLVLVLFFRPELAADGNSWWLWVCLVGFGLGLIGLQPIPYYVLAFILLILFGFVWPVLPITGGYEMNADLTLSFTLILDIIRHSILPAMALILVGAGSWLTGMRALTSNIVTEDYVTFAELGGVGSTRILRSYVVRNAVVPQLTGLAMSLGAIFNGTVITEIVFGYPGIGTLLINAVHAGDYSLVLGLASLSIIGVAIAGFLIDILSPLLDPRIKAE